MIEKICASPVKNYIQRNGFVMVSNLLIDYQQELGITEMELSFLIKVMKNRNGYAIHDSDLDSSVSSRTLSRRRISLRDKGYLKFSTIKEQDPTTGIFKTKGISYDLSPLEEKLQAISDKLAEKQEVEIEQEIKAKNYVVEQAEKSPLETFKRNYYKFYGVPYNLSDFEIKKYNSLSEENKQMIGQIFNYCQDNNLFGKVVPRLSLFFKTAFRFADLKKYCINNGLINPVFEERKNEEPEEEIEDEAIDLTPLIKEIYYKYYEDEKENYPFYKAVERIVNRRFENGKLLAGTEILLDRAYKDSYNLRKRGS